MLPINLLNSFIVIFPIYFHFFEKDCYKNKFLSSWLNCKITFLIPSKNVESQHIPGKIVPIVPTKTVERLALKHQCGFKDGSEVSIPVLPIQSSLVCSATAFMFLIIVFLLSQIVLVYYCKYCNSIDYSIIHY